MTGAELNAYSAEVLAFQWKDAAPDMPLPAIAAPGPELARILRLTEKSGRREVVLFGLGTGGLAAALARDLPAGTRLTVLCLDPAGARALQQAGRLSWVVGRRAPCPAGRHLGLGPAPAPGPGRPVGRALLPDPQPRGLGRRGRAADSPCAGPGRPAGRSRFRPRPGTGPAAYRRGHPQPRRAGPAAFFARLPGLAGRGGGGLGRRAVPDLNLSCAAPCARRPGPWPGTSRPSATACWPSPPGTGSCIWTPTRSWNLRTGCGCPGSRPWQEAAGWHLPRLTFYPDPEHCRLGFGLWPDLQLRLFSGVARACVSCTRCTNASPAWTGRGRGGGCGPAPPDPRAQAPEDIRRKLTVFDQASGERVRHAPEPGLPAPALRPAGPGPEPGRRGAGPVPAARRSPPS
jgi:hypothetical protein